MARAPILQSRRLRGTPFTQRVEALNPAGYTIYNKMFLPTGFQGLEEDCAHLKNHAQIWDVSVERQVELKGPDARKLACLMSARDLREAQPGRCYYAPITDKNGGMINDPVALCLAEDKFWFSIADSDMLLWADGLAHGLDLDVEVIEPDVSPLAIQGPMAEDLMVDVFGEEIRNIKFFRFKAFPFMGRMLNIARSGWSKQGGFEIYLDDSTLGNDLWDAIWSKGEPYDLRPGCPNLIERIESGLLSYGNDMTRQDTPLEIDLQKYCALDGDGEFIGKDALRRQRDTGIQKRLMGVLMGGDKLAPVSMPVPCYEGKSQVGILTSGVYSPDSQANIGFAMLDFSAASIDNKIRIETSQGPKDATVVEVPQLWSRLNSAP